MELRKSLSVLLIPANAAVIGDMGLDTLQSHRDRAKLKWWHKLATLLEDKVHKAAV